MGDIGDFFLFDFTLWFRILHRCLGCPTDFNLYNDASRRRLGDGHLVSDGHVHHGAMTQYCENCTLSNHCAVNATGQPECFVTITGLDLDILLASWKDTDKSDEFDSDSVEEAVEVGSDFDVNNALCWSAVVIEPLIC